jgi:threonine dehydrogenase-like Zn-dependent dehydrogenase
MTMTPHTRHQALVRSGTSLQVAAVPTASPPPGGLLIELSFVGVCGTDLQILNGTRPDTAEILGHEGVGVVVQALDGAPLRIGESVVFNPTAQMSANRILGHNVPGLFQQYFTADESAVDAGLVVPAKDCTPPISGALIEPLGSVVYAHELISRSTPDLRTVAIFGAGPIGLLSARYLLGLGVKVLLIHPGPTRLKTAVSLKLIDATSTLGLCENLSEQMLARNEGIRFDAALICTTRRGAAAALAHAVQVVKSGGCIDMMANYPETAVTPTGISPDAIRAVRAANACGVPSAGEYLFLEVAGRRIALTGHRGTSRNHLLRAVQMLRSSTSLYARIITHILSLRDAAKAIESLASSQTRLLEGRDCIKAVIDLTSSQGNGRDRKSVRDQVVTGSANAP